MWAADRLSKNHHTFWLFTSTFPWSWNSTLWFWQFRTAQLRTHAKVIIIPVLFFSQLRLLHFVVVCSVVQLSSVILSWWFVVKQTPPSAPPVFISSSPPSLSPAHLLYQGRIPSAPSPSDSRSGWLVHEARRCPGSAGRTLWGHMTCLASLHTPWTRSPSSLWTSACTSWRGEKERTWKILMGTF